MICFHCKQKMVCLDTRNFADPGGFNFVQRRKKCPDCGHQDVTIEVPRQYLQQLAGQSQGEDATTEKENA